MMGPLVPDIIGNELNYIVALIIGIAFGFVLEQAGFSSSKKLVGVFYGYDFVVLRVFFTAAVTAMLGVIIFSHYGLLDIDFVYVNPTFLWSAIVGGAIMGVGFILGGYCPGTSVCAAAVGKIDAMLFILGSLFGVLFFAEGYPMFEKFYKGWDYGNLTVFDSLSISQGTFALLLTVIALGAFWMTTWIEKKVNKGVNHDKTPLKYYLFFTVVGVGLAIVSLFMPSQKQTLLNRVEEAGFVSSHSIQTMDCDEITFRIIDNDAKIQLIDVRDEKTFAGLTLPGAVNIPAKSIFGKEWFDILSDRSKKKVFFSDNEELARKAAVIASELGYTNNYILAGGLNVFKANIINFQKPTVVSTRQEIDTYRFREKAHVAIPEMIQKSKSATTVKKVIKKIAGGC